MEEVLAEMEPIIARSKLTVSSHVAPDLGPIVSDRQKVKQVVLNLLSNALKHTFDGGIRVEVSADGEHAELRVIDTGAGIPEADLPRLFNRFSRLPAVPARSTEGSGIGLALVRRIAEAHGGEVTVASVAGRGATFALILPLAAASEAAAGEAD